MKRFVSMLTVAVLIAAMFPAALYAAPEKGAASEKAAAGRESEYAEIAKKFGNWSSDPFDYRTKGLSLQSDVEYPSSYDLRNVDIDGDGEGDTSYVTPVKFQNPFGTCWGFAAIAAAESSILGSDLAAANAYTADNLDLSEKHLVYFVSQPISDPENPQYGEGTHAEKDVSLKDLLNGGGMPFTATSLFASGIGPVLEDLESRYLYKGAQGNIEYIPEKVDGVWKNKPYSYDDNDDWSLPEEDRNRASFMLSESFMLPSPAGQNEKTGEYEYNPDGTRAIKDMLTAGRAVQIGFCADTSSPNQISGDGVYISKNWAHYTYDKSQDDANHAVTIVGWDDNYPRENFVKDHEPPDDMFPDGQQKGEKSGGNGAWLIKNSWGSEERNFPYTGPGWGIEVDKKDEDGNVIKDEDGNPVKVHSGYFWLSYYDKTLSMPEALDFDLNNADGSLDEDFVIDQHDFMPVNDVAAMPIEGDVRMANVFKAESTQRVEQVSCETTYPGTKVINEVYLLANGFDGPTDGVLMDRVESEPYKYGGFHKINLNKPVLVQKGQSYSIVQTQITSDGNSAFNVPLAMGEDFAKLDGSKVWVRGVINENESFAYVDGKWYDYSDSDFRRSIFSDVAMLMTFDNFPIKGYGTKVTDSGLTVNVLGSPVFDLNEGDTEHTFKVRFTGNADPEAEASKVTWKLSEGAENIFTLTTDDDDPYRAKVTANDYGSGFLYAEAEGIGTTVIPISVNKLEIMSVSTHADSDIIYNGMAKKPKVTVDDVNGEMIPQDRYTVKYKNNVKCGRATVVVTIKPDDPKYKGDADGFFEILPARSVIKKLIPGKGKLTVKVKDQKKSGISKYEVRYRIKGKKKWSKKLFKASSGGKLVLKKLKKGKKYQVKVCALVADSGSYDRGAYSKVKTSKKIK